MAKSIHVIVWFNGYPKWAHGQADEEIATRESGGGNDCKRSHAVSIQVFGHVYSVFHTVRENRHLGREAGLSVEPGLRDLSEQIAGHDPAEKSELPGLPGHHLKGVARQTFEDV